MKSELLTKIKEEIELRTLRNRILKLSSEEKNNINKIINFAITWWLKDIKNDKSNDNAKDTSIDRIVDVIIQKPLTNEELAKLENFKSELGFAILKEMIKNPQETIVLHCGYSPDGILGECINRSQCEFLNIRIPLKSKMTITRDKVYVKEGYEEKTKLAFDINKEYDFPVSVITCVPSLTDEEYNKLSEEEKSNRASAIIDELIEKINGNDYLLPEGFIPSEYDFVKNNSLVSNVK